MFEFSVSTGDIYMSLWPSGVGMLKRDAWFLLQAIAVFSGLPRHEFLSTEYNSPQIQYDLVFMDVGRVEEGPGLWQKEVLSLYFPL